MTPAINDTGLLCVESGGQRAKPGPFCDQLGPLDHEKCPTFGVSLCLRPQCFSGSIFVTFSQDVISFCNPLNFSVCSLTNPLQGATCCAPWFGHECEPSLSYNLMSQCTCKGELGQSGPPRCQNDLSVVCGPTAHRVFQSVAAFLPHTSASCLLPVHALILPHQLSTSSVHLPDSLLAVCHQAHDDGPENWHF